MTEILARLSKALADRYKIEGELGAGGMATVYLAEDLKHHRKVAVKVLRSELAAILGAERFLKEIEVTANLQHPNILPLYDSGEADTFLYYVMPYVEGETLRDKLNREKQLAVEETVEIAKSVAGALSFAHSHGVIHRDIKPENILLQAGQALVADFGIALAVTQAGGTRLTETGLSLGTPHYMSPEQATGDRELDARSDVYSLGCVVYEMLVGEPPHHGPTGQAIIAQILTGEVDPVTQHRPQVPPNVDAAVRVALNKTPADRFATATDLAEALVNPAFETRLTTTGQASASRGPWKPLSFTLAALVTVMVIVAIWGWIAPARSRSSSPTRLVIPVPGGYRLRSGQHPTLAISHDGRTLVYRTQGLLHLRELGQFDTRPLPGTDGATSASFSPGDRWVLFTTSRGVHKLELSSGFVVEVAEGSGGGSTWGPDGTVIYAPAIGQTGLWRVSADGGPAEQLTTVLDSALETAHMWPQALPRGRGVLFTVLGPNRGWRDGRVAVLEAGETRHRVLLENAPSARYVSTGHLLYALASGAIMAAPFDLEYLRITGPAMPMVEGVLVASWGGAVAFAVSEGGTAAYAQGRATEDQLLQLLDRRGNVIRQLGPPLTGSQIQFSPDGRRLAMMRRASDNSDIWMVNTREGALDRISFAPDEDETPIWSPNGQRVAYSAAWTGQARRIFITGLDGGEPTLVHTVSGHMHLSSWSPDGEWLLGQLLGPNADVWLLRANGSEQPVAIAQTEANEGCATFTPDARWITYTSNETGRREVYAVAFPDLDRRQQVTADGASCFKWAPGSNEVFYRSGGRIMVSTYSLDGDLHIDPPEVLFSLRSGFVVSPDGQMIGRMLPNPEAPAREIRVVLNFLEELKAKVGN